MIMVVANVFEKNNKDVFAQVGFYEGTVRDKMSGTAVSGFRWKFLNLKTRASIVGTLYGDSLESDDGESFATVEGFFSHLVSGDVFYLTIHRNGLGARQCRVIEPQAMRSFHVAASVGSPRPQPPHLLFKV